MPNEMYTQQVHAPEEIKQDEAVRKYRLQALEEKQQIIINKLDVLSSQLQQELYAHDKEFIKQNERIKILEKRANNIDEMYAKIRLLVIAELVTIVGAAILWYIGIN